MAQTQTEKRAWIFANGELSNPEALRGLIGPGDFLVAADGGLHHMRRLGLQPGLVIGDLDSLEPAEIEQLETERVPIERHPVHKDETDLELTVEAVLRAGYPQILIVGALGGRLDMTLANIFLLALPGLASVDARLEDGVEEVFLIRPGEVRQAVPWAPLNAAEVRQAVPLPPEVRGLSSSSRGTDSLPRTSNAAGEGRTIIGQPGDGVSLLPWGGPARGIRTSGLYYPLRGETLFPERTRGVSNVMVDPRAQVSLEEGLLICIHTRQPAAGSGSNRQA